MKESTKDEVESAIIKDNSDRFRLVNSSPLLRGDICSQLGISGEGVLADEMLSNQVKLEECPKVKEVLGLFKKNRRDKTCITIKTDQ